MDASDILEVSEFSYMVIDIIEVSAGILPFLAIGEGIGSMTKDECEAYADKLLANKEKCERGFVEEFKQFSSIGHEGC